MGSVKLYWESSVWEDYVIYCDLARPDEISGMGEIELVDNKLTVTKLHLIKQDVSPGSADFDDEAYAEFFEKYCDDGGDPEKLRLWWHTHPNMSVDFSAKDRNTIKETMKGSKWFVAVVINEKGDKQGELLISDPAFLPPIKICKEDFILVYSQARRERLQAEVKEKITKSYGVKVYHPNYSGKWQDHLEDWYGDGWPPSKGTGGKYGGFNGLGSKPNKSGYHQGVSGTKPPGKKSSTKSIKVPSVLPTSALSVADEEISSAIPEAEVLRENVTADIINNLKALSGKEGD